MMQRISVSMFGMFALMLLIAIPLAHAESLSIRPLGNDPWMTGPESKTNGVYKLTSPIGLAQCNGRVPLWVMDVGTAIAGTDGKLEMIVGGDTFYMPEDAEQACRTMPDSLRWRCENVKLPSGKDGFYASDCTVDADCTEGDGTIDWRCDSEIGFCVVPSLYSFCNSAYDRHLLQSVLAFCYQHRGANLPSTPETAWRGEAVCDWVSGDHHCLTELYDDTCADACRTDGTLSECKAEPCSTACTRACNRAGHCRHRNQTFHTARVLPDGEGGYRVELTGDEPGLIIERTAEEWDDAVLFGVYPGDWFRDTTQKLYLLTDTRTWLAMTDVQQLLRSGIGVFSMSDRIRLRFGGIEKLRPRVRIWKSKASDGDDYRIVHNPSPYVLFPRGWAFSEVVVVHNLLHDAYSNSNKKADWLHLLGSGPACPPGGTCIRSEYTNRAALARVPRTLESISDPTQWQVYTGMINGKSQWAAAFGDPTIKPRMLYAYAGYRPGSIVYHRGEYWQLTEIPNPETGEYLLLHLLRSPDGLHWFDGGSFDILQLEQPRRTAHVYSAKWLPPAEAGDDLGFILSHWLSYPGYFRASEKSKRFRDYNMRTYRLTPPATRSYAVLSDHYTGAAGKPVALPLTVYRARGAQKLKLQLQACECPRGKTDAENCRRACAPWRPFGPATAGTGGWRDILALDVPNGNGPITLNPKWEWRNNNSKGTRVILRAGLYRTRGNHRHDEMLNSIRILPDVYRDHTELWNDPYGWHCTDPILLKP